MLEPPCTTVEWRRTSDPISHLYRPTVLEFFDSSRYETEIRQALKKPHRNDLYGVVSVFPLDVSLPEKVKTLEALRL